MHSPNEATRSPLLDGWIVAHNHFHFKGHEKVPLSKTIEPDNSYLANDQIKVSGFSSYLNEGIFFLNRGNILVVFNQISLDDFLLSLTAYNEFRLIENNTLKIYEYDKTKTIMITH